MIYTCLPEEAFDCPAGSGAILAFLPTWVIWDSVLRATNAGLLPIDPLPTDAVVGGSRGAGGGIAPLILGLATRLASLCLPAAAVAALTATCNQKGCFEELCICLMQVTAHDGYNSSMRKEFQTHQQTFFCPWTKLHQPEICLILRHGFFDLKMIYRNFQLCGQSGCVTCY